MVIHLRLRSSAKKTLKIGSIPYSTFDVGRSMLDVHLLNNSTPDPNAIARLDTPALLNHSQDHLAIQPISTLKRIHMPIDNIPQRPIRNSGLPEFKLDKMPFNIKGDSNFPIRKATVADVKGMLELINGFASANLMLPRGPRDLFENIRDFVVATEHEAAPGQTTPFIIACGGLHVLWEDMAEVRSMAIHPDYQQKGLGRKLVEFMKKEAVQLGVKRLYTFTLAEEFFKMLGFRLREKEELPSKLWDDCSRCPKFFKCDEVGMVLEL